MGYIEELRSLVGHRPLILVGACALITDERGWILLQKRRAPEGTWGIPGGLMELGESAEETARREIREEVGLELGRLYLFGVYSGVQSFTAAPNGDQFYPVTVAYTAANYNGKMIVDPKESEAFSFCNPEHLPERILKNHRNILNDFMIKK